MTFGAIHQDLFFQVRDVFRPGAALGILVVRVVRLRSARWCSAWLDIVLFGTVEDRAGSFRPRPTRRSCRAFSASPCSCRRSRSRCAGCMTPTGPAGGTGSRWSRWSGIISDRLVGNRGHPRRQPLRRRPVGRRWRLRRRRRADGLVGPARAARLRFRPGCARSTLAALRARKLG